MKSSALFFKPFNNYFEHICTPDPSYFFYFVTSWINQTFSTVFERFSFLPIFNQYSRFPIQHKHTNKCFGFLPSAIYWIMSPPKSYVEALIPVMVLGDEAFGRWGLDEVMRVGPSWWDQCPYKKSHQRAYSPSVSLCHVWTQWRKQLPSSWEERSHQVLTMLVPWSQTSSIQNCEKINFCCLSPPVYNIL